MSRRLVIGPRDSLVEAVAGNIPAADQDLSHTAVVFPGRRPAHFLRKHLALRARRSIVPPKIFSIDEYVRSLYQQIHPDHSTDIEAIDAVALLFQVHGELKERLGGEYFASIDSFIPIGLKLFGELEELRMANLPESRVRQALASLTHNRLFSLSEYYERFYALTKQSGYITRAGRHIEVASHASQIRADEYERIIVAGLLKLTHVEQEIFDELERRPNTIFIFQSDALPGGSPDPEISFYKATDTHGQVFALSALLQERLTAAPAIDEHSVIVLPSAEALFPVVQHTLALLPREEYNIALGYPLARTPVYGFLHNLLELLCTRQAGRYSSAHYLRFILHPYTKNIRFEQRADVTRMLFHALEASLAADKASMMVTLEELEQAGEVFTDVAFSLAQSGIEISPDRLQEHIRAIHAHTIHALDAPSSLRDFSHKVIDVLSYVYDQSTAQRHPLFRPYAEAMLDVFLKIENSLLGQSSFANPDGYLRFLEQYVAAEEVPFSGTPLRGLQVLGLLETRGLCFDDVYLMNVNEDVLPGGPGGDLLLPQQLREQLGLETRRDRDALVEYYFHLLVRGSKRVHLFFSESGESAKSRFIERLLWERQKADGTYSSDDVIQTVRYQVKLAAHEISPIPKSAEVIRMLRGMVYSPSALDTYLHCPIKFYYQYIVRLKERNEVSMDFESQDIGTFIHEILRVFFAPLVGTILSREESQVERMARLVDDLFGQSFGEAPPGAAHLLKRQIRSRMEDFLTDYQMPLLASTEVLLKGVEQKISASMFGYRMEGRVDRIEERKGAVYILDYKTGTRQGSPPINYSRLDSAQRDTWAGAMPSLQLPLYLLLYHSATGVPRDHIMPAYLFLGERRIDLDCEVVFDQDAARREDRLDQIQQVVRLLLEELNTSEIPFAATRDKEKNCPRCPFTGLCGTAWVRGRRT